MKTERSKIVSLAAALGALFLAILACGSPTKLATVNLHAEQLNQALGGMVVENAAPGWRFEIERVELLDGALRVFGAYQPQGGQAVQGSLDVAMSMVEDEFEVEVIAVDIPGVGLGETWLQRLNSELARLVAETAGQDRMGVKVVSVKITPQALQVGLRFFP
jgi:hypothetical protein